MHCAQVDLGADKSTALFHHLVHAKHALDPSRGDHTSVKDSGGHSHPVCGVGYFIVHSFNLHVISTLLNFLLVLNVIKGLYTDVIVASFQPQPNISSLTLVLALHISIKSFQMSPLAYIVAF